MQDKTLIYAKDLQGKTYGVIINKNIKNVRVNEKRIERLFGLKDDNIDFYGSADVESAKKSFLSDAGCILKTINN